MDKKIIFPVDIKRFALFFICLILTIVLINPVPAEDSSEKVYIINGGIYSGFSPYTGNIGIELHMDKYSLTLGSPASIGFKYYFHEQHDSFFLGAHAAYCDYTIEKTIDNISYNEEELTITGLGIGYRWRYQEHWDILASISMINREEKLKNSSDTRTDESTGALPGIAVGYIF